MFCHTFLISSSSSSSSSCTPLTPPMLHPVSSRRLVASLLPFLLLVSFLVGDCSSQRPRDNNPTLSRLVDRIRMLEERLKTTIDRLENVESCDCTRSCHLNGSIYADGTSWKNGCDVCVCVHGTIKCKPKKCPRVTCRKPELLVGECCPVCKRQCLMSGQILEHGDRLSNVLDNGCYFCECIDGNVKCHHEDRKNCQPLSCPESQQFLIQGECCPTCLETTVDPRADFPATIDPNVEDLDVLQDREPDQFLDNPSSAPLSIQEQRCTPNQTDCGPDAHCDKGYCRCFPGFRPNGSSCDDVDECARDDDHKCHPNARCVNIRGGYTCECLTGFDGDGRSCDQVTTGICLTGGVCVILLLSCMFFTVYNYLLFRPCKKEELNPS